MKRLLLLATTTGYQIRAFGAAAERAGVRLIFASDRCDQLDDPWWDGAIAVKFHEEDAATDRVVRALAAAPPDGILAVGDRPTTLAARLATAFGLPGNSRESAAASRHKLTARRAFRAAALPTPSFETHRVMADPVAIAPRLRYPVVVKPAALSGSRGVMRADDAGEFVAAFLRLRRLLHAPDIRLERDEAHEHVIVEQFIPGREYAIEGVLTHGRLTVFAIFDKPDPLDGPFFEETIYVTPSRADARVQAAIVDGVAAAARALGLQHGPVHAECRVNTEGVYVLEVAARPIGGLCARALRFSSPADREGDAANGAAASLEEVLVRHAVGEDVTGYAREAAASGVMMIPIPRRGVLRGVEGVDDARAVNGVESVHITAKADALLVPLPEGRSYLGFIFARGGEAAEVEHALRAAHARLSFAIERELPINA